jgi:hypothetical protein
MYPEGAPDVRRPSPTQVAHPSKTVKVPEISPSVIIEHLGPNKKPPAAADVTADPTGHSGPVKTEQ